MDRLRRNNTCNRHWQSGCHSAVHQPVSCLLGPLRDGQSQKRGGTGQAWKGLAKAVVAIDVEEYIREDVRDQCAKPLLKSRLKNCRKKDWKRAGAGADNGEGWPCAPSTDPGSSFQGTHMPSDSFHVSFYIHQAIFYVPGPDACAGDANLSATRSIRSW